MKEGKFRLTALLLGPTIAIATAATRPTTVTITTFLWGRKWCIKPAFPLYALKPFDVGLPQPNFIMIVIIIVLVVVIVI